MIGWAIRIGRRLCDRIVGPTRNHKQRLQSQGRVVERLHAATAANEKAGGQNKAAIQRREDATDILRDTLEQTLAKLTTRRPADASR
jgi:hypothetical protein